MQVNLSVKNVPDALAAKLRARAERNHRSLQGELMAILESAANDGGPSSNSTRKTSFHAADPGGMAYALEATRTDNLLARLSMIAGEQGIDTTTRLTREQAHDRIALRNAGV